MRWILFGKSKPAPSLDSVRILGEKALAQIEAAEIELRQIKSDVDKLPKIYTPCKNSIR